MNSKPAPRSKSFAARFFGSLLSSKKAVAGLSILALMFFLSTAALLLLKDPTNFVGEPLSAPTWDHWFGTNGQGQDVMQLTLVGTAQSLSLALITGIAMTVVSVLIGISAGYMGGRFDQILSSATNITLVLPGLPLAIVIAAFMPTGPWTLFFVLLFTGWAWNARVFRSLAVSLRGRDFVAAARVSGESHLRVILSELLPNCLPPFLSALVGSIIYVIAAQVGLEFLGIGDMTRVSWGTNLFWATNDAALLTDSWWIFVPTGLIIALVSCSLTLLNDAVDEIGNPALKAESLWVDRFRGRLTYGITPLASDARS